MQKISPVHVLSYCLAFFCAGSFCAGEIKPILSVPDFNGDGTVNEDDIQILVDRYNLDQTVDIPEMNPEYRAIFDVNADKRISIDDQNGINITDTTPSSIFDQQLLALYNGEGNQFNATLGDSSFASKYLGIEVDTSALYFTFMLPGKNVTFQKVTTPFNGHGYHYTPLEGVEALTVVGTPISRQLAVGLNVEPETKRVRGVFWGRAARPLFFKEDHSTPLPMAEDDYPDKPDKGEKWKDLRVRCLRFPGDAASYDENGCTKPTAFPVLFDSPDESWHAHGGLCQVVNEEGDPVIYQFVTFNECQQYPNFDPGAFDPQTGEPSAELNAWVNFGMLHVWIDKLNPNGIFGNVHPDVASDYPNEACVNVRPAPDWFHTTHSHGTHNQDHAYVSDCKHPEHQATLYTEPSNNTEVDSGAAANAAFSSLGLILSAVASWFSR